MGKRAKLALALFPESGSRERRVALWNACVLAEWLQADLHAYVQGDRQFRELDRISHLRWPRHSIVSLGAVGAALPFEREVLSEVEREGCGYLLLERQLPDLRLVRDASCPVILLSSRREKMDLHPFRSLLVPLSGIERESSALQAALELGNRFGLPVDLVHVTDERGLSRADRSMLGRTSDQFHHEYPRLREQLIAQACPYASLQERQVIRDFVHCAGLTEERILGQIRRQSRPLVVLEWKGSLAAGRARMVRWLARRADPTVLLLRERRPSESVLRAGGPLRSAA